MQEQPAADQMRFGGRPVGRAIALSSITTTVQGGRPEASRPQAARRLAWERLARSLLSCVSSSHRNNSAGPNRSRGSISRTTRYTCGRVIRGIFFPPILLQAQ